VTEGVDKDSDLPLWGTSPLSSEDLCGFLHSGRAEIDQWLAESALSAHTQGFSRTFVWSDQPPYVAGFYSLVPHRVDSDEDTWVSGHAGGALSGYLLAKIGLHRKAVGQLCRLAGDSGIEAPAELLLILDAHIRASRASYLCCGRYLFVDTSNEPPHFLEVLSRVGFHSISPGGNPLHVMLLRRPSTAAMAPHDR